jgi:hypothetical protein
MTSRKTDIHVLVMPIGGMDEALCPHILDDCGVLFDCALRHQRRG